jgi:hypothetical protein
MLEQVGSTQIVIGPGPAVGLESEREASLIGTQACSDRSRPTYTVWRGCVVVLGGRPSFRDRGLGKPFQAVAVADFTPTDVDIDPGMDPVAVAAAWPAAIAF